MKADPLMTNWKTVYFNLSLLKKSQLSPFKMFINYYIRRSLQFYNKIYRIFFWNMLVVYIFVDTKTSVVSVVSLYSIKLFQLKNIKSYIQ